MRLRCLQAVRRLRYRSSRPSSQLGRAGGCSEPRHRSSRTRQQQTHEPEQAENGNQMQAEKGQLSPGMRWQIHDWQCLHFLSVCGAPQLSATSSVNLLRRITGFQTSEHLCQKHTDPRDWTSVSGVLPHVSHCAVQSDRTNDAPAVHQIPLPQCLVYLLPW